MADPGEGLYLETHIMHTMGHALDEGMAHCASETKIFQISTQNTTYMMGVYAGKHLLHLYYGRRVEDADCSCLFTKIIMAINVRIATNKVGYTAL